MPTAGYARAFPVDAGTVAGVTPGVGGLAVLDDASPSAIRSTLSLGAAALLEQVARSWEFFNAPAAVITNIPVATAELFGVTTRRIYADLTGCTSMRVTVHLSVAANAGAKASVQYSLDGGTNWFWMDGTAAGDMGAEAPQVSLAAIGAVTSAYQAIAEAAKTVVLLRPVTDDGDAAADPQITYFGCEAK